MVDCSVNLDGHQQLGFQKLLSSTTECGTTQCDSDYFQVGGAVNEMPVFVEDNDDQYRALC